MINHRDPSVVMTRGPFFNEDHPAFGKKTLLWSGSTSEVAPGRSVMQLWVPLLAGGHTNAIPAPWRMDAASPVRRWCASPLVAGHHGNVTDLCRHLRLYAYQGDGVPEVQDTRRKAASRMTNRIAPETWNVPSVHGRMLHGNICLCFPTAAKLLSGTLTDIPCSLHTPIPCYVFSAGVPPSVPVPSQPVRHTGMAHHAASFGSGLRQDRPTTMPSI